MKRILPLLLVSLWFTGCGGSGLRSWLVDPLVKVFPDDSPGKSATRDARLVARNGHSSVQIAIRSAEGLADLAASVEIQAPLTAQVRRVGYVPVGSNPPGTPHDEIIREAPSLYPDPLFEGGKFDLLPDRTEAFWVTVSAPPNASPSSYSGEVKFRSGGAAAGSAGFKVRVTHAAVPAARTLNVTNWFWLDEANLRRHYKLTQDPEAYWRVLANTARVLAEHRQNVILTPVFSLVETAAEGGRVRYGFSRFDRWVETFRKAGVIGTIEGGHLLGRASGYHTSMIVPAYVIENGAVVQKNLDPDDPRAEQFFDSFLSTLHAHLKEKGWLANYIQHIHDEPHDREAAVYNRYAKIIRKHLPAIPTIDAVGLDQDIRFFADVCDIWVPVLGSFDNQLDSIRTHVEKGGQGWFYTCIGPQGRHLNRFIDYPLLKVRLLHWFNFRHNLTGFLHWGGNYWGPRPFANVQPVINDNRTLLPAGDSAIVYPNPEKESVLSSMRLETMREGIEDYELLAALAKRDPAKAARLVQTAIPHISDYVRDVRQFRALERDLLEE